MWRLVANGGPRKFVRTLWPALVRSLWPALVSMGVGCGGAHAIRSEGDRAPILERVAACPRDARPDARGRCTCTDGTFSLLGACVPPAVGDAFCGVAARVGQNGCAFRSCAASEELDLVTGQCIPPGTLAREPATCADLSGPLVADGRVVCAPLDASCPRGTTRTGHRCVVGPRCPPGTLVDGPRCRPFVFAEGPERTRVDLGTFLALAVGRDGGAASPDLCRPLALRALLFGVAAEHLHGIKLRLTVTAPDQDLTRLVVATQAYGDSRSLGLSVGLENDLRAAAATLLEPLRGVGGEASAAETTLEIACDW